MCNPCGPKQRHTNKKENDTYQKQYGITHQLLHAYRLEFKEMPEGFEDMVNLTLEAPLPTIFSAIKESN